MATENIVIRKARPDDAPALVEFNKAIARETEHIELKHELISAGVDAIFEKPERGFYIVAEHEGEVVGSLMVTTEWSDWRNGVFWWVQSVYIVAPMRRKGIYRRLYEHVKQLAEADGGVCGFRLYVERENTIAQQTYSAMGMTETPYLVYEELAPGVEFTEPKER